MLPGPPLRISKFRGQVKIDLFQLPFDPPLSPIEKRHETESMLCADIITHVIITGNFLIILQVDRNLG